MPPQNNSLRILIIPLLLVGAFFLYKWGFFTGTYQAVAQPNISCISTEPGDYDDLFLEIKSWSFDSRTPTQYKTAIYWSNIYLKFGDSPRCADNMLDRVSNAQSLGSSTKITSKYSRDVYVIDNNVYWCYQDKILLLTNSLEVMDKYFDEFFTCQ